MPPQVHNVPNQAEDNDGTRQLKPHARHPPGFSRKPILVIMRSVIVSSHFGILSDYKGKILTNQGLSSGKVSSSLRSVTVQSGRQHAPGGGTGSAVIHTAPIPTDLAPVTSRSNRSPT